MTQALPFRRLKASEIGYWDPDNISNEKSGTVHYSVELFIQRLEMLADLYGEQEVVLNMQPALIHKNMWLLSLSKSERAMTSSLSGWIHLLQRDFGMSESDARAAAREYTSSQAQSGQEYWEAKLALLRIARMDRESDQYFEIRNTLPALWKMMIPEDGCLTDLKAAIRQMEKANAWPSQGSYKVNHPHKSDTDPGLLSDNIERTSTQKRIGRPPACRICAGLGFPGQEHWHRDCHRSQKANNSTFQHSNRVTAISN